ncbi:hypothetical protein EDD15DRAFT_2196778 [Pisolithus albus]|nr:hypothetical protein EDD15DRAFT_2196778 [Pisolithus albus]
MNFSQQSYTSSSSQAPMGLAYSMSTLPSNYALAPFFSQESSTSVTDQNSPEVFKQNVQIALDQVARIHELARSGLNGMQNAYQVGNSPAQTEADLIALDLALHTLADFLKTTDVVLRPEVVPVNPTIFMDAVHSGTVEDFSYRENDSPRRLGAEALKF